MGIWFICKNKMHILYREIFPMLLLASNQLGTPEPCYSDWINGMIQIELFCIEMWRVFWSKCALNFHVTADINIYFILVYLNESP